MSFQESRKGFLPQNWEKPLKYFVKCHGIFRLSADASPPLSPDFELGSGERSLCTASLGPHCLWFPVGGSVGD